MLIWVRDRGEARRLLTYGVSLAGGSCARLPVFASTPTARRSATRCRRSGCRRWSRRRGRGRACLADRRAGWSRLGSAAAGRRGARRRLRPGLAALPRPARARLARARAAVARQGARGDADLAARLRRTIVASVTLPLVGLIGYALMLWTHRRDRGRLRSLARRIALPALLAAALLLWQTRAGPAAQLLADPRRTALAWTASFPGPLARTNMLVRVLGAVAAFLLVSGSWPSNVDPARSREAKPAAPEQAVEHRQRPLPDARRAAPGRAAAARQGADLRRSRAAADHGHPSRRDRRPLSPQRRARSSTSCTPSAAAPKNALRDGRARPGRLCADLPEHVGIDHLPARRRSGFYVQLRAGTGAGLARAGAAARATRPTGCGGSDAEADARSRRSRTGRRARRGSRRAGG